MSTQPQALVGAVGWPPVQHGKPLAAAVGFFLCFRLMSVLIAVRLAGADPQTGVAVSLMANFLLLASVLLCGEEPRALRTRDVFRWPCMRPALLFLGISGASLLWSVTVSLNAAAAFWSAMVADTAMVLLLVRGPALDAVVDSLFRGYIWAACGIAAIAWSLPAQSDLRLGDEELLGPNQIGWACAFALFLAQYLGRRSNRRWGFASLLLAVTLLRSLSKTTIIALLVGQAYIVLRDRGLSRKTKILMGSAAVLMVAGFWGLFSSYYDVYTNAGNQSETLTGRLGIWAYILNEALDRPWLGHGFHSVWKVIPPFGVFEARHAHNELLQQFYTYGLVGVGVLVAIYGSVWRQLRRSPDSSLRVFFQGMLLFVLVRGLADTEAFDLSLPIWFIAILGALLARANHEQGVLA
jgi:hypothetical protein